MKAKIAVLSLLLMCINQEVSAPFVGRHCSRRCNRIRKRNLKENAHATWVALCGWFSSRGKFFIAETAEMLGAERLMGYYMDPEENCYKLVFIPTIDHTPVKNEHVNQAQVEKASYFQCSVCRTYIYNDVCGLKFIKFIPEKYIKQATVWTAINFSQKKTD
ncbi:hypothetical protein FJ366_01520 [Candidatus Dependentiae bacterium]|nr:hypothetical protein [Candidatus Dependentiae bacterium]